MFADRNNDEPQKGSQSSNSFAPLVPSLTVGLLILFADFLIRVDLHSSAADYQGTSIINSLPMKVKFGRRRPFMYFAAVWESAVIMIGSAIVASQLT